MNYYQLKIYSLCKSLLLSKPIEEWDNFDISTIFEYYCCIMLSNSTNQMTHYNDLGPDFKEKNQLTKIDTGIDACDLEHTIVQCKLRKKILTLKDCSTFFASQNIFNEEKGETVVRWKRLIIARNSESILHEHLAFKKRLFCDVTYPRETVIDYCKNLLLAPPESESHSNDIQLRPYQIEAIELLKERRNQILCLPTGSGKTVIIAKSLQVNKKYLILVPRVILLYQMKKEISEINPFLSNHITLLGDKNRFVNRNIIICCYNSISELIKKKVDFSLFEKIFIDEAHHIRTPEIYEDNIDDEFHDDEEEEEENEVCSYIQQIRELSKYNNNVYLSATIDAQEGFEYYKKSIRELIDSDYLCDYQVKIPIFLKTSTDLSVCKHLTTNYNKIIIYCSSKEEGKRVNQLMNSIRNKCSQYIDSETPKGVREETLEKFANGALSFVVNVRVLIEGFNAPVTNGVCFYHLPSSETNQIQIIGRCLRKHPLKKFANVIIPFCTSEDNACIRNLFRVLSENDPRIKQSIIGRKMGYIDVDVGEVKEEEAEDEGEDESKEEIQEEFDLMYEAVLNSYGNCINRIDIWIKHLEEIKKYIDEFEMRPPRNDKNKEVRKKANWISTQIINAKERKQIMNIDLVYNLWIEFITNEQYKKHLLSNIEIWKKHFVTAKSFIRENKNRPTQKTNKSSQKWISQQISYYSKRIGLMANDEIYNLWTQFITSEEFSPYFISKIQLWLQHFETVKKYIDTYGKKPARSSKDETVKFYGCWVSMQLKNHILREQIMANDEIYKIWCDFMNEEKYKHLFVSEITKWKINLASAKLYIDNNGKRPNLQDKDKTLKQLAKWISHQVTNYNKKQYSMKNEEIYNLWQEFIKDDNYRIHFIEM